MDGGHKLYAYSLLQNVHLPLVAPLPDGKTYLTRGDFTYYHYRCDGLDDVGWGCAYRTLQSSCSWILENTDVTSTNKDIRGVPSIPEIQETLVSIDDKPRSFLGSREWIGALEVFYVIDTLYDVPCRILHIPRNDDIKKFANVIKKYFEDFGGLVMMGGDVDASSKGIAGIHIAGNEAYLLVVDPHYVGKAQSATELIEKGYVSWSHTSQFMDSSFYNLCLPQIKIKWEQL